MPAIQSTVLDHGEGVGWLLDALTARAAQYDYPQVIVDDKACAHLLPELERVVGFDKVIRLSTGDIPRASSFWLRLVTEGRLLHRGEAELTSAMLGAGQRKLLDGWAFSRTRSGGDITPLIAQCLAASYWLGAWGGDDA